MRWPLGFKSKVTKDELRRRNMEAEGAVGGGAPAETECLDPSCQVQEARLCGPEANLPGAGGSGLGPRQRLPLGSLVQIDTAARCAQIAPSR